MKFLHYFFSLVLMLSFTEYARADHGPDFSDLPLTDPYHQSIKVLKDLGFLQGNPDGTIRGGDPLNRAELATIVIKASKRTILVTDKNCFPDVKEEWFAGAVCAAKRHGAISGYPDGFFRPERDVSAGESAKILLNVLTGSNHTDLTKALLYLEESGFYLQKVEGDVHIKRNEAFERLFRILQTIPLTMDQQDSQGNPFDPKIDPIKNHIGSGDPAFAEFNQNTYDHFIGNTPMILFFHASWCPLCRKSEEVLLEMFDELEGGVIWFKVDYDTETELRKKYEVTYQDTFIIINEKGEVVAKGATLGSYPDRAQQWMNSALVK